MATAQFIAEDKSKVNKQVKARNQTLTILQENGKFFYLLGCGIGH